MNDQLLGWSIRLFTRKHCSCLISCVYYRSIMTEVMTSMDHHSDPSADPIMDIIAGGTRYKVSPFVLLFSKYIFRIKVHVNKSKIFLETYNIDFLSISCTRIHFSSLHLSVAEHVQILFEFPFYKIDQFYCSAKSKYIPVI